MNDVEPSVAEALEAVAQKFTAATSSPFLRFERVYIAPDHDGSAAAFMTGVLRDQAEVYGWTEMKPIDEAVWEEFRARHIDRIPYLSFRQESDTDEVEEDDDEEADGS